VVVASSGAQAKRIAITERLAAEAQHRGDAAQSAEGGR
jgi:hypothetical protein